MTFEEWIKSTDATKDIEDISADAIPRIFIAFKDIAELAYKAGQMSPLIPSEPTKDT